MAKKTSKKKKKQEESEELGFFDFENVSNFGEDVMDLVTEHPVLTAVTVLGTAYVGYKTFDYFSSDETESTMPVVG
jgi:hypothetical protein